MQDGGQKQIADTLDSQPNQTKPYKGLQAQGWPDEVLGLFWMRMLVGHYQHAKTLYSNCRRGQYLKFRRIAEFAM